MSPPRRTPAIGDQQGFTLVELVVALVAGLVILFATLALLDLSVRLSARAADRVEASQRGRTAMEQLMQELHSSCVAASVTPVLAGSDSSNIQFLSQFGSAAVLTPNLHKVSLAGGALTDTVYAATGGSAPSWTFSATPTSTRTFITNVSHAAVNGTTQPVFRYYGFVNGQLSTTALATPLSVTDAQATAQVAVSFAAGPSSTSTEADRTINLSDAAVLRYVPASGATNATNLPCQ
jgi:prepilin-type N-terminal cleavage/methylation domain-containing protein